MLKVLVGFSEGPAASDAPAMSMAVDLLFNLAAVMLPYAVCIAAVLLIRQLSVMRARRLASAGHAGGGAPSGNAPMITAGLCLGIGLGGFINGIMLQQILRWHQMLSSCVPPVTLAAANFNMMWDGVAYLMNLAMTMAGMVLLFRAARRGATLSSGVLVGSMLGGWGMFTVAEGTIDHLLLGAHHTHSGPNQLAWDLGYLMFGAALMLIGSAIVRRSSASCPCAPPMPT